MNEELEKLSKKFNHEYYAENPEVEKFIKTRKILFLSLMALMTIQIILSFVWGRQFGTSYDFYNVLSGTIRNFIIVGLITATYGKIRYLLYFPVVLCFFNLMSYIDKILPVLNALLAAYPVTAIIIILDIVITVYLTVITIWLTCIAKNRELDDAAYEIMKQINLARRNKK